MRKAIIICLALALQAGAGAQSLEQRLREGNALLRGGDIDGASGVYRDLHFEEPDSDRLHYALGCAHYEQAERLLGEAPDEAAQAFTRARESFAAASWSRDPVIRRNAAFNEANTLARVAMTLPQEIGQEALVQAFGNAVNAYEDVLRRFPDHADARQNLDHLRYQLKKMLQNPPQEQQQQEGDGDGEQQEGDQDQEQDSSDQSEQGGEQEQDQQQEQQQSGSEEQEQDEQQQDQPEPEPAEQEPGEQEAPDSDEEQDTTPDASAAQEEAEQEEAMDRQSVEAILQSLEEMDQQEQRQMRTGPTDNRLRREWW
jgi:hypothetical protein